MARPRRLVKPSAKASSSKPLESSADVQASICDTEEGEDIVPHHRPLPLNARISTEHAPNDQFVGGLLQSATNCTNTDDPEDMPEPISRYVNIPDWCREYLRVRHGLQPTEYDEKEIFYCMVLCLDHFYTKHEKMFDDIVRSAITKQRACHSPALLKAEHFDSTFTVPAFDMNVYRRTFSPRPDRRDSDVGPLRTDGAPATQRRSKGKGKAPAPPAAIPKALALPIPAPAPAPAPAQVPPTSAAPGPSSVQAPNTTSVPTPQLSQRRLHNMALVDIPALNNLLSHLRHSTQGVGQHAPQNPTRPHHSHNAAFTVELTSPYALLSIFERSSQEMNAELRSSLSQFPAGGSSAKNTTEDAYHRASRLENHSTMQPPNIDSSMLSHDAPVTASVPTDSHPTTTARSTDERSLVRDTTVTARLGSEKQGGKHNDDDDDDGPLGTAVLSQQRVVVSASSSSTDHGVEVIASIGHGCGRQSDVDVDVVSREDNSSESTVLESSDLETQVAGGSHDIAGTVTPPSPSVSRTTEIVASHSQSNPTTPERSLKCSSTFRNLARYQDAPRHNDNHKTEELQSKSNDSSSTSLEHGKTNEDVTIDVMTTTPPPPSSMTERPPEVITIRPSGPRMTVLCNRCKLEIEAVGLPLPVSRSTEAKDPEFTVVKKKKQKEEVPRRTSERLAQRARKTWVDAKPQRASKKRKSKEMN